MGVAKAATIHSVRIDDGDGVAHTSDIIAGLDWVALHRILPAVANLSYTLSSEAGAHAASGVIGAGVSFAKAAGNDNVDACNSVSQVSGVITVGATVVSDRRASYSNFGSCVDVFAPGGESGGYYNGYGMLELPSKDANNLYTGWSGTSFASPAVAGVAALMLEQNATLSPATVAGNLVHAATTGVVIDPGTGSPNRLLYSRIDVDPAPPPPPTITGPNWVRPGSYCLWTASPGSAPLPVTYQWFVDGIVQSETSEFFRYYAGTASFSIVVVVTDANNDQWASSTHYVDVSNDAPECFDQ